MCFRVSLSLALLLFVSCLEDVWGSVTLYFDSGSTGYSIPFWLLILSAGGIVVFVLSPTVILVVYCICIRKRGRRRAQGLVSGGELDDLREDRRASMKSLEEGKKGKRGSQEMDVMAGTRHAPSPTAFGRTHNQWEADDTPHHQRRGGEEEDDEWNDSDLFCTTRPRQTQTFHMDEDEEDEIGEEGEEEEEEDVDEEGLYGQGQVLGENDEGGFEEEHDWVSEALSGDIGPPPPPYLYHQEGGRRASSSRGSHSHSHPQAQARRASAGPRGSVCSVTNRPPQPVVSSERGSGTGMGTGTRSGSPRLRQSESKRGLLQHSATHMEQRDGEEDEDEPVADNDSEVLAD
uniref:Uncharacterized protein n=1 Tax=Chromera velia CCMP2878 TaxID=1169474 RepID=A0A0G4HS62_9ALVE|eukprot:Cvel_8218.t1-p1 / transcript=Cvel_8218.t1 / gene=Cvel_8218 / organism=Chromera_velia_CCMP2878 / gene_product=hypothetical protein / transcript_product=hypothetical protein / location=Cvel_scaffold448:74884-75918(+) / protein_length=345 / sequence_SO=supercontig / SO=protein_coding / is_pseudo=false